jgi:Tol biopolymer transport system component
LGGCDPAWSPDGTRLAFTAPDGVWVVAEPDDVGERLVDTTLDAGKYTAVADPQWSPDGERLAFKVSGRDGTHAEVVDAHDGTVLYTSDAGVTQVRWVAERMIEVNGRQFPVR